MSTELRKRLEAAVGYLELGMFEDACVELNGLPTEVRTSSQVIGLRLSIYRAAKWWGDMATLAGEMARLAPEEAGWWVHWADAVRNGQSLDAGRKILLEGVQLHPANAHIQFQLACYSCLLGETALAKDYVHQAVALESQWQQISLRDPDLKAIWPALRAELKPKAEPGDEDEDEYNFDEDDGDEIPF